MICGPPSARRHFSTPMKWRAGTRVLTMAGPVLKQSKWIFGGILYAQGSTTAQKPKLPGKLTDRAQGRGRGLALDPITTALLRAIERGVGARKGSLKRFAVNEFGDAERDSHAPNFFP